MRFVIISSWPIYLRSYTSSLCTRIPFSSLERWQKLRNNNFAVMAATHLLMMMMFWAGWAGWLVFIILLLLLLLLVRPHNILLVCCNIQRPRRRPRPLIARRRREYITGLAAAAAAQLSRLTKFKKGCCLCCGINSKTWTRSGKMLQKRQRTFPFADA